MGVRLALASLLLSGCALFPFEESDCRGVNWQTRGYRDGYTGQPQQYSRLVWECTRFGVEVSEAEYFKGWYDGRFEYDRLMGWRMRND